MRVGIRSSREKKFRGRPTGEDERRWCILSIARRGEARKEEGGTEREGVSFKLEIASSAAMMGRKLGAKLNARERSMADELGREGGREEDEALSNRQLRKRDDESNNILIFVRSGEVEDCWERRMFSFPFNYFFVQV